jgi:hypothetical protein
MCGIGLGGIGGTTLSRFNRAKRLIACDWSALWARLDPAGGFGVALSHAKCRT